MRTVQFKIPGPVKGKARPRMTKAGIAYTPKETVQYENLVRMCYKEQASEYLKGALDIIIVACFEIPKSTPKYKRRQMIEGKIRYTKKPDWDNIGKIICDSLNGVAYRDDSQIATASVLRQYTDGAPYVSVRITELEEDTGG